MKETGKTRLLIVDDEAVITLQLEGYLTSMGYEVVGTASSGEEAIAMARDLRPDLIMSDVVMPGKFDGIEAAVIIKSELDIPVVFLSAYTEERLLERAKDVEPLAYIVKPFTEQSIKASLEIALYKRDMELWRKQSEEELRRSKEALQGLTESLEQRVAERTAELEKSNEQLQEEVAERKRAEEELRAMSKVFMDATDPIFIEDLDRKIIDVNAEAERAYGWTREELLGRPIDIVIPPEAQKRQLGLRPLCLQGKDVRSVECLRHSKSGKMFNVLLTLSLLSDEAGKPAAIATIVKDITARKQAEKTIEHMAYHDHLTGLPNRKLFSDRLTKAIAHAKRYKQKLAVMFLDLDNFKDVNDALGHTMGDELLKAVGERLKGSLREEDTVARLGGDEFILLLPEIADKEGVATVAQKTLMLIGKPLTINNNKLDITTSIGVALYPDDTNEAETLVRYADAAMYHAKEKGRDNFQFHTPKK